MVNLDLLFAIIFYGLLLVWFLKKRDRFEVQGKVIALYKTQIGIKLMNTLAGVAPRFTHFLGYVAVWVGFAGMAVIFYFLTKGTFDLLFIADTAPAVAPVLPGIHVPGLPVLSFWHWVIGIFFVATVHEFSHGIWARLYKLKVKSSGILFFGPILGAFVEPDEKQLAKRPRSQQLAVFAAGPFSNVIFGFVFLLLINFVTGPVFNDMHQGTGVEINKILEDFPAAEAGMEAPIILTELNGMPTTDLVEFVEATKDITPGSNLNLVTDKGNYDLVAGTNPENASRGYIGVSDFSLKREVKPSVLSKFGAFLPAAFVWFHMLIFWLIIINFGIGLFNLLPLGPIDGGRMFLTAMQGLFKDQKMAHKVWVWVSFFCLALIFINLAPYLWQLVVWLFKPVMMLGAFLG